MQHITLFPGDGIGPEISAEFKRVCEALNAPIVFDEYLIGEAAFEKYGTLIPEDAVQSIKQNKIALKAPVTTPIGKGFKSVTVQLRTLFDLYINFRPAKTLPNTLSRFKDVDLVTFRENTEDLYIGDEYEIEDGYVARKKITKSASDRIIRAAFDYAVTHGRHCVTCVHKANILKKTDGLFLDIFNQIAAEYPTIESNNRIIDNMCMQLVMNPSSYDVLVAPNLYGDIITDLIAGLVGGLGMAPAANIGRDAAIFEAVHGSAPDIAGRGIANPTAFFLSGELMLDHIGLKEEASRLKSAIVGVLEKGLVLPKDLGGSATTKEYTDAIIEKL